MMDVKVKVYTRDKAPDFNQNRPGNISDEVVLILCVGKLVEFDDFNRFLRVIGKCITAPGWSMKGAFMRDTIPTSRRGDDMDGLDRCLLNQHEIDKFKDAYYTVVGPSCD